MKERRTRYMALLTKIGRAFIFDLILILNLKMVHTVFMKNAAADTREQRCLFIV